MKSRGNRRKGTGGGSGIRALARLLLAAMIVTVQPLALPITAFAVTDPDECLPGSIGGHQIVLVHENPASCSTGGTRYYECSQCHKKQSTESTPALGHNWDGGTVTKEATCTEAGEKTFHCSRCTDTKSEQLPALGHNNVKSMKREPTCTQAGEMETKCSRCGKSFTERIAQLGHNNQTTVTKQATSREMKVHVRMRAKGNIKHFATQWFDYRFARTPQSGGFEFEFEGGTAPFTVERYLNRGGPEDTFVLEATSTISDRITTCWESFHYYRSYQKDGRNVQETTYPLFYFKITDALGQTLESNVMDCYDAYQAIFD